METDIPLLISIAVTMILSAFFSGMEIAFVSSNRMLAEMDREGNHLTKNSFPTSTSTLMVLLAQCL